MKINRLTTLSRTFDLVRDDDEIILTVHRRGSIDGDSLDAVQVYVPEGSSIDIPRSFIYVNGLTKVARYRENVSLEAPNRQRPMNLKHILEINGEKWVIMVMENRGNIRRKIKELEQYVKESKRSKIHLEGVILLVLNDILSDIVSNKYPMKTEVFSFNHEK